MVHCNNGASEINAWAGIFAEFAHAIGSDAGIGTVFETLFTTSLDGDPDCGGLLSYNYLAGEVITGLSEGRPLFLRTPNSRFTLANFIRSQICAVFGTLTLGMRILESEQIDLDTMLAHGGLFKTRRVAQGLLAAALNTPVAVAETAGDGGAWGMAILAAYLVDGDGRSLSDYLDGVMFADAATEVIEPEPGQVAGFRDYLRRYEEALPVMHAAVEHS
ncbi:MAG: FGGY-family carbohydrate kinase, partial [Propionicimonas sp.]|nr:FGGY-family carbohydrate kinase [Propionicimonas sp.]